MDREERLQELAALKTRVSALEAELAGRAARPAQWAPETYYTTYHLLAGMVLGMVGAAASLLFNIVGSAMVDQNPLHLIRVYLTFPLGQKALDINSGFALAAGCCLYLGTGMLLGIPFHLILSRFFEAASMAKRLAVASALGVAVWLINYYGILWWLQPLVVDGKAWIVEMVPVYVAVLTHLIFAWTMLLVDNWGRFVPPVTAARPATG